MVQSIQGPDAELRAGTGGFGGRLTQWTQQQLDRPRQIEAADTQQDVIKTELDIMQDANRFRNMYSATQQAMQLPAEQRQQFLKNRVNELRQQGVDPSETLRFMEMTPDQQEQAAKGMTMLGERLGHLNAQKATTQKNLIVKRVKTDEGERFHGFDPITGEFRTDLGAAGDTGGNITIGGEQQTEYQKQYGKNLANMQQDLYEGAQKSRNTLQALDEMANIVDQLPEDEGGYVEALPDTVQNGIRAAANIFGFDTTEMDNRAIIDGIRNRIALASKQPGTGAMTDNDFNQIVKGMPNSLQTPAEMKKGMAIARRAEEYKIARAQEESKLIDKMGNREITQAEAQEEINKWAKKWRNDHPLDQYKIPESTDTGSGDDTGSGNGGNTGSDYIDPDQYL